MIDPALATHDDQQEPEDLEIDLIDADGLLLYSNYNRKGILKDNLLEHKKFKAALAADDDTVVTIAEDGNEAVQKALAKQFDLIFMDIEMPSMNGYEATQAIRKAGTTTPIRSVFLIFGLFMLRC